MRPRFLLAGLLLLPLRTSQAQDTTRVAPAPGPPADSARCGFCHKARLPVVIFEGFLVNGAVNRFNAWVLRDSLFYVNSHS